MKRELKQLKPKQNECCPGHDASPNDTYRNNRSKRARAKAKKLEHKYVRTLAARLVQQTVLAEQSPDKSQ